MSTEITYRLARGGEEPEVCALVARVFNRFVAPDFSQDGVDEFLRYARPDALSERSKKDHVVLVGEEKGQLIGVLEVRQYRHIALLFVELQGRGVARELLKRAVALSRDHAPEVQAITVHASRHALPVYQRLGFKVTASERTKNGITYTPMALPAWGG
jgi:predicted GNAT family N-acyltransferase